jgi:hypothetical protein
MLSFASLRFGFAPLREKSLNRAPSGNQVDYQYNHSHHEQQVDKAAANVRKQANQPQNQQNHDNCPQHVRNLLLSKPTLRQPVDEQRPCQRAIHVSSQKRAGSTYLLHHNHPLFDCANN